VSDQRPWYREPMVWMIIAFPLTAVIAGIATYIIADRTRDGLVVDDYYKKGKEINLSLARDHAAVRHGLSGRVRLDRGQLVLKLAARPGFELPDTVSFSWLHATRSGFDRTLSLSRDRTGNYRSEVPDLAPGHWYLQIEAQDWRLQGSLRLPQDTAVELRPSRTP